jgi:integrase
MDAKSKLLVVVRDKMRARHFSYRTERAYLAWIRRFILHYGKRHPTEMGAAEVENFLTHLAVERRVSASTQNQALGAILFLYRHGLETELPWLENVVRARKSVHVPVVLPKRDVQRLLAELEPPVQLIAQLLYGSGLRLMEALRLRVKDIDFEYSQVVVRDGKGRKDRVTILPDAVAAALQAHLRAVKAQHSWALQRGYGGVELPQALAQKYPGPP